jgi:hypothetical protein
MIPDKGFKCECDIDYVNTHLTRTLIRYIRLHCHLAYIISLNKEQKKNVKVPSMFQAHGKTGGNKGERES